MKLKHDDEVLVTRQFTHDDDRRVVPGSTSHRRCGECGARVWVAPIGEALFAAGAFTLILCLECATRLQAEYVDSETSDSGGEPMSTDHSVDSIDCRGGWRNLDEEYYVAVCRCGWEGPKRLTRFAFSDDLAHRDGSRHEWDPDADLEVRDPLSIADELMRQHLASERDYATMTDELESAVDELVDAVNVDRAADEVKFDGVWPQLVYYARRRDSEPGDSE